MMFERARLCCAALGLVVTFSDETLAFCQATTCADLPEGCERSQGDGCALNGEPLVWMRGCVAFNVQADDSTLRKLSSEDLEEALLSARDAWLNARCEEGPPAISIESLGEVECATVEYNPEGANANIWMFRDVDWEHGGGAVDATHLAYTTLTYNLATGELLDADVEINTMNMNITHEVSADSFDLRTVVTHEMGHFLGLDHTREANALMEGQFPPGEARHSLRADDEAGICALYGSASTDAFCTPEGGFSAQCGADQPERSQEESSESSGCSWRAGRRPGEGTGWVLIGLLCMAGVRRLTSRSGVEFCYPTRRRINR